MGGDPVAQAPLVDPFVGLAGFDGLVRILHPHVEAPHGVGEQQRLHVALRIEILGLSHELPGRNVEARPLAVLAVAHEQRRAMRGAGPRDVLADERGADFHPRDDVARAGAVAAVLVLEAVVGRDVAVGRIVGRAQPHRDLFHERFGFVAFFGPFRGGAPRFDAAVQDEPHAPHHEPEDEERKEHLDEREGPAAGEGARHGAPPVPAAGAQTRRS